MPLKTRLDRAQYLTLAVAAAAALAVYLTAAALTYRSGFPLDDAWIHQTYARNLAQSGEFSFRPGEPSAGSTAPLWSFLLAVGHWLRFPPLLWVSVLGWTTLFSLGALAEWGARRLVRGYAPRWPWIGLFFTWEWHHVWAALSGMETALFMLGTFWVLIRLLTPRRGAASLGVLVGTLVWLRPDALTLIGPVMVTLLLADERPWLERWRRLGVFFLTLGVPLAFYALFNLLLDGTVLPNTFYAKQAEYASLLQTPLWRRLRNQFLMPLVGAGVLLLPAWFHWLVRAARRRDWASLAVAAWTVGYLTVFALRLPVVYQHGRYQMPVMPIFFFTAFCGLLDVAAMGRKALWVSVWRTGVAALLVAFWALGARAYALDVACIEGNHVEVARWVADHLPADALLAVHDVGALGYFAPQPLLDMAGLVSPEVIPFIRDESRLASWLDASGAQYLIVMPGWYDRLPVGREKIFCGRDAVGLDTALCVYLWP